MKRPTALYPSTTEYQTARVGGDEISRLSESNMWLFLVTAALCNRSLGQGQLSLFGPRSTIEAPMRIWVRRSETCSSSRSIVTGLVSTFDACSTRPSISGLASPFIHGKTVNDFSMARISSCRISIAAFSFTPGPSQKEEVRQAAEEMEQCSSEVSFFRPLESKNSFKESTTVWTDGTGHSGPVPEHFGSIFADGFPVEMYIEANPNSDFLQFSRYDVVHPNNLQTRQSPSTYQLDSYTFPPFRQSPSDIEDVRQHVSNRPSLKVFNPNYPSFIPAKIHPPFRVHVDEIPQPSSSVIPSVPDLVYENETSNNPFFGHPPNLKRSRHGGKENEHRLRHPVRRKLVPKVVLDEHLPTPSAMKVSSMPSFPELRARNPDVPKMKTPLVTRAFGRTDTIGKYYLTQFLSQGAQGKVYLARSKRSNKVSAIKVISKLTLENYQTLLQEQDLLKRLKGHPFVLNLVDSFHDTENFYLITDYYPGGDLAHLLHKRKVLDTDMARFYIAELVVGIKFLHSNEIIHRDLKPSNILIKRDGHICIVDFGLCKDFHLKAPRQQGRLVKSGHRVVPGPATDGFAGTLVYMSPQVISQELYSYETDWWSMGIILYELLQGDTPWTGPDVTCMMRKIKKEPLLFRMEVDDAASDLLYKLLEKRVEDRIHVSELASHEFFDPIDFGDVEAGLLIPPYIPQINDIRISSGILREKERIYVGRAYERSADPFPEYTYNQLPESPIETDPGETLTDTLIDIPIDPDDFVLEPDPNEAPTTPRTTGKGVADTSIISPLRLDQTISSALISNLYNMRLKNKASASPKDIGGFNTPRRSSARILSFFSGIKHGSPSHPKAPRDGLDHACSMSPPAPTGLSMDTLPQAIFGRGGKREEGRDGSDVSQPRILEPYTLPSPSPRRKKDVPHKSSIGKGSRNSSIVLNATPTKSGREREAKSIRILPITLGTSSILTPFIPSYFMASRSSAATTGVGNSLFSMNNLTEGYTTENSTVPSMSEARVSAFSNLRSNSKGFSTFFERGSIQESPEEEEESDLVEHALASPPPLSPHPSPTLRATHDSVEKKNANLKANRVVQNPLSATQWIKFAIQSVLGLVKDILFDTRRSSAAIAQALPT